MRRWAWVLAWAILLQLWAGYRKRSYHIDEGFTYMLASLHLSEFQSFLHDPPAPVPFGGQWASRLADLLPQDHGRYREICRLSDADGHPPLYSLLLHETIYRTGGKHSKWQGIGLNMALNVPILAAVFGCAGLLYPGRRLAPPLAAWLCASGLMFLDLTIFARMYTLLMLWSTVLLWLWLRQLRAARVSFGWSLAWAMTVALGSLSHYYFVPWAGLVTGLAVVSLGKRWQEWLTLLVAGALGLALFAWIYPPGPHHMTRTDDWRNPRPKIQEALAGRSDTVRQQALSYLQETRSSIVYPGYLLVMALGSLVWLGRERRLPDPRIVGLAGLCIAYWGVVSLTCPMVAGRYLAPIVPVAALLVAGVPELWSGWRRLLVLGVVVVSALSRLSGGTLFHATEWFVPDFYSERRLGIVFVNTRCFWQTWRLFYMVLPDQSYVYLTEKHLNGEAGRYLSARQIERLRQESPDFANLEVAPP